MNQLKTIKQCSVCKETKEETDFYRKKKGSFDRQTRCKTCTKEAVKKWASENRIKANKTKLKWARENRDKVNKKQRDWLINNPEKAKAKREIQKKWYRKNQDITRNSRLKYVYGITLSEYENMLKAQNGVCAICFHVSDDGKNLCVDHNHDTGEVRGLLCSKCNTAIGLLKENTDYLLSAIKYLNYNVRD